MISVSQRFSWAWFLIAGAMLALPNSSQSEDECGLGASATAGTTRFALYASDARYDVGTIVRHTIGDTERLYRATGAITGAPGGTGGLEAMNGWSENLAASDYAQREIICDDSDRGDATPPYDATIEYDDDNLAIIYRRSGTAQSIRHTGASGEIHIQSGTITKPNNDDDGHAVSIVSSAAGNLHLTTNAGTFVSNRDTDTSQRAIYASVSVADSSSIFMNIAGDASTVGGAGSSAVEAFVDSSGSSGNIALTVSGNTSTTGAGSSAIQALITGSGDIDIDITGGMHTASGTQGATEGVVFMATPGSGGMGQITLDISSDATVRAMGSATRAIFLSSRNTATATARTIGTGNFMGSRVSNAGTVIGDFLAAGDGDFLFENSGSFTGAISMSGGDDEVQNTGTLTLDGNAAFGGGTMDAFTNTGILVIDHNANGDAQISLSDLEEFSQAGGVLRFVIDLGGTRTLSSFTAPLLALGGATATFSSGTIELAASAGNLPNSGILNLISATSLPADAATNLRLSAFLSGTLSVVNNVLQITFSATAPAYCGTNPPTRNNRPISPGVATAQVFCDDIQIGGITTDRNQLALVYTAGANAAAATPFIRHTGAGGEIHIRSGSDPIVKTGGADGFSAVSVVSAQPGDIAITTAAGTSVSNLDTDSEQGAIFARNSGANSSDITLNIAGRASTVGTESEVVFARLSDMGSTGDIAITVSGDTSATGDNSGNIGASSVGGSGGISINVAEGTHVASGIQRSGSVQDAVVFANSGVSGAGAGQITIDIASDAAVHAMESADRAIYLASANTASMTARTIGTEMWSGSRVSNAGTVIGDFLSASDGNVLFENAETGSFTGALTFGAGADEVSNAGIMILNGDSDFGTGTGTDTDTFINTGTLVIDHATHLAEDPANTRVNLANLETFTFTGGTLRFIYDFNNAAPAVMGTNALLHLGGASPTFPAGMIEVIAAPGSARPQAAGTVLPLIAQDDSGSITADITELSSDDGALALTGGVLQITLSEFSELCGKEFTGRETTPAGESSREVVCDAPQGDGILSLFSNLAILYDFSPAAWASHVNYAAGDRFTVGNLVFQVNGRATRRQIAALNARSEAPTTADAFALGITEVTTPFIRHEGGAGEIHFRSGVILRTASGSDGAAISAVVDGANRIGITTSPGTLASNTDPDLGVNNAAIRAQSGSEQLVGVGGDIVMNLAGRSVSASESAIVARTFGQRAVIDVEITGGTHTASGTQSQTQGVLLLRAFEGQITLDISSGAIIRAEGEATRAIVLLSQNYQTRTPRTIGTGMWEGSRISNAGTIIGDIRAGTTAIGAFGADLFENARGGSFTGGIYLGDRDDEVHNAGTLRLTKDSSFGDGRDALVNQGALIIDAAANGGRLAISGLETLTQNAGFINFVFDFRNPLPTDAANALLNIGAAQASFGGGQIRLTDSRAGESVPYNGTLSLIAGSGLSAASLSGITSSFGDLSIANGVLRIRLAPPESSAVLQNYDALLQAGWHADQAFSRALYTQSCMEEERGFCTWGFFAPRFTRHDPTTNAAEYDEDAYNITAGADFRRANWRANWAISYEGAEMDIRAPGEPASSAEAHRFLAGISVSSRGKPVLFSTVHLDAQLRFGYTAFDLERTDSRSLRVHKGSPELTQVAAVLGTEQRGYPGAGLDRRTWIGKMLSPVFFVSRGELGVISQRAEGFSERGVSGLNVHDINEVLGFAKVSMEVSGDGETRWGFFSSRFHMGAKVFVGNPASSLTGSVEGRSFSAEGSLPQAMMDFGLGFGYDLPDDMDLNLRYDAGVSFGGETEAHNLTIRLNAVF